MKIISWNVNGIRSAHKKGFWKSVETINPDIVCLQEIKAQKNNLEELFPTGLFTTPQYHFYSNPANKPGYSGVAVLTKKQPVSIKDRLILSRFDEEGRILELKYPEFTLINLYIPHGGRIKENLPYKLEVYNQLLKHLKEIKETNIILTGDFNIAHTEMDLARPKENRNNTMFTPEERDKISELLSMGFVDSFRKFDNKNGGYTWWPYAYEARERNLGWRLDYIFVSRAFSSKLKSAFILPGVRGSDHCPVGIEII